MKPMIISLILFICMPIYIWGDIPIKKQLLTPEQTINELKKIKAKAISFGSGKNEIHTFIDPHCELSQRYLAFVFKKKEQMFAKYTFYFYLNELKGKDSAEIILSILSAPYPAIALKTIMLQHGDINIQEDDNTQDIVDEIEESAKLIGVFKRPYIIINGKVK